MSSWLSEPQRERPWNAIGGVPARPVGPRTAENLQRKDNEKGSEHATRGSASNAR